ncbi:DUF1850 domain-containing protein [Arhodomonas sp. SL1]|uniref:DUF1850 domain-containing protein n=1 Tax=Arhodomonas sp. SL1 TaxID=3425691 RepID=UPI003F8839EC
MALRRIREGTLAAVLFLTAAGAHAESWLEVATVDGRIVERMAISEGARWCLHWNHSVQGFAVADCYVLRDQRMWLERSHQPDYAAGLGTIPGRGRARSDGEGGYWIEGIDEPVSDGGLRLRVGSRRVDHRLRLRSQVLHLSDRLAGEAVIIRLHHPGQASVDGAR